MLNFRRPVPSQTLIFPLVVLLTASCAPEPDPPLDEAFVIVNNTSVRAEPSSASRTLFRLPEGERVSVFEKAGTWYRIRDRDDFEGWMDESTILRDSTAESMRAMIDRVGDDQIQNTVTTLEAVNLRLEPGRETPIVRRLRRNLTLAVLDRATTPRPDSDATDIWFLVRPVGELTDQIGWVYAQLVEFDTPDELRPFTEGRIYAGVQILRDDVDDEAGPVRWYVIAERRPGADPELAFDGIRVFTWNRNENRHETSLRLRNVRGAYPLELTGTSPPGFRFHVLNDDGTVQPREFVLRGTIPREVPVGTAP